MRVAAIGLGSNVGDRLGALRRALSLLKRKGVEILRKSDVFETPCRPDRTTEISKRLRIGQDIHGPTALVGATEGDRSSRRATG